MFVRWVVLLGVSLVDVSSGFVIATGKRPDRLLGAAFAAGRQPNQLQLSSSSESEQQQQQQQSTATTGKTKKTDNKAMAFLRKIGRVGGSANRDFTHAIGIDEGPAGKTVGGKGRKGVSINNRF